MSRDILIFFVFFFLFNQIASGDWLFNPRFTVQGVYTDNLRLAPANSAESDYILQLNPGFMLQRQSGRFNATLNYNMQNLLYKNNSNENTTNHQLTGTSTLEMWRDRFFLDVNGFINQSIINPQNVIGADNVAVTNNLTDVYTLRVSPYWAEDFAGYANLLTRYSYDIIRYDQGAADSDTQSFSLNLTSGRRFTALNWQFDYFNQQVDRSQINQDPNATITNSDRESFLGQLSYNFNNTWAINARAGYEDNNIDQAINGVNGSFWSLGFTWTPSRFVSASLFYGPDDKEIRLQYNPTARTSFMISRRDRSVGVDTGVLWTGTFNHRTRYSTWAASYTDATVSGGTLLFDDTLVACTGSGNDNFVTDNLGILPALNTGLALTNSDFRRKRFQATLSYARARTNLSVNSYLEERTFATRNDEQAYGFGATLNRNFGPRTVSTLLTCWQHNEFTNQLGNAQESSFWTFQASLTHTFTDELAGALAYRYARQDSDDSTLDYRENRIFLLLQLQF